jgi:L,D-transpeptidase catalytic domain
MRRNRRQLLFLAASAAVLLCFAAGASGAPGQGLGADAMGAQHLSPRVLSNERSFARWAHPRASAAIRSRPGATGRLVGHVHMSTEEGRPEVYLLLQEVTAATGVRWVKLRIPGRPNGRTGWVPSGALGAMHATAWALRVNLRLLRATLFRSGRAVWSAPVGVGKASTPTPPGRYWVRELLRVSGETIYGPYAFGTSDYSVLSEWPRGGVIGIHGTNEPELVPGRPSHGCIRMRNSDIVYLAHHLPIGAPVHVVG